MEGLPSYFKDNPWLDILRRRSMAEVLAYALVPLAALWALLLAVNEGFEELLSRLARAMELAALDDLQPLIF